LVVHRAWLLALGVWVGLGAACNSREPVDAVILIAVDTLRADHVSPYGAQHPTTPFLEGLAREGRVFERAYATSPWTLPSFASMLTGLTPTAHAAGIIREKYPDAKLVPQRVGPRGRVKLAAGVTTLAERLAGHGIATLAVVQNPNLDPVFGLDRGFDVYDYTRGGNAKTVRADTVVDRALAHLDALGDQRFFLLVHLFDPHLSYDPPPSTRHRFTQGIETRLRLPVHAISKRWREDLDSFSESDQEFIRGAYDEEIAAVDEQLERLVAGLRDRELWQRSLVLFTSDHGEEFFEHGGFEHGHSVYDELVRVPMIAWGPGVKAGREKTAVSGADVAPTALVALGATVPGGLYGESLWPLLVGRGRDAAERTIVAEGTLYGREKKMALRWPHKLVVTAGRAAPQLYDLDADPAELRDVHRMNSEVAHALRADLDHWIQLGQRDTTPETVELDPELSDRLRELGYLE
jgi:arylsulfatase A-like enzyme